MDYLLELHILSYIANFFAPVRTFYVLKSFPISRIGRSHITLHETQLQWIHLHFLAVDVLEVFFDLLFVAVGAFLLRGSVFLKIFFQVSLAFCTPIAVVLEIVGSSFNIVEGV